MTRPRFVTGPYARFVDHETTSPKALWSSGIRSLTVSASSSVRRTGRPGGIPFQGFVVSEGHMTAMFPPVELRFFENCRFIPSPKERRRRIDTVPHAIEAIVRRARFFARRDDWRKRWKTTLTFRLLELHRHDRVEERGGPGGEPAGQEADHPEHGRRDGGDRERHHGNADVL